MDLQFTVGKRCTKSRCKGTIIIKEAVITKEKHYGCTNSSCTFSYPLNVNKQQFDQKVIFGKL